MTIPLDPYDPLAPYPAWDGAWPPDPSWDDVPPEAMPVIGMPPPAPIAPVAAVMAPEQPVVEQPPEVQLGFPRVPAEQPWDADQIEIEPEADWTGLADPYAEGQDPGAAPGPADEDLIELEPNEAEAVPLTEAERGARLAEIASPAQLAEMQFARDMAAEQEAVAKRLTASTADREDAEANERVYKEAVTRTRQEVDAVSAESDRLANERVDPDGWRDSRSLFQTIAMYAAGIVGGLVQSRQGGPNQGLAMINNAIEQHIDAQKANLAHRRAMLGDKRSAIGEDRARVEEDFRTEESFRQAAYKRAIEDIDTEAQQYDPVGTRVLKLAGFKQQLAAQAAAGQEAYADKTLKQQMEIGTQMRAEEKHILDMQKTRAETAKLGGGGGGGGAGGSGGMSAAKVKRTAAAWNAMYPGANVPDDGTPLTIAEYRQRGETGKSLTAPTEQEKEARNLAVTGPRGQLKQRGGAFYNPPTEAATKTRNIVYTTGQIVADLDRALYLRDSVGGELGQLNSNERQEYDQIEQRVTLMAKGQNEGMSSDSDLKRLGMSLGVENLASFRSKSHGLKTARDAIERQANGWLAANNYTGDPVTWPNTQTKSTKRTAKEKFAQDLIKSNAGNDPSRVPTAAAATGPLGFTAKAVDWAAGKIEGKTSATPDEEKKMRAFIRGAQKGDAASLQALRDIKDGSNSEAFRNQAEAVLAMHEFLRGEPDEDDKDREAGEAFLKDGD